MRFFHRLVPENPAQRQPHRDHRRDRLNRQRPSIRRMEHTHRDPTGEQNKTAENPSRHADAA